MAKRKTWQIWWDGVQYNSMNEAAAAAGVSYLTMWKRQKAGIVSNKQLFKPFEKRMTLQIGYTEPIAEQLEAIGNALAEQGHDVTTRGQVSRSKVVLQLIQDAYERLQDE